jgi:excisionase family DNA binding protein
VAIQELELTGLFTISEVATFCRVSEKTVRRWITSGRLDAVTLPAGTLRVRAADLLRLMVAVPTVGVQPSFLNEE